jgi:NAD(P)-dependent dehydrogenase (short-subunit alcohol dehydrogenase family)
MVDFSGRTAIVTGGAQGMGRHICQSLAEAGAAVAVLDIDGELAAETAEAIRAEGGDAFALAVDVADREVMAAAFATCWERWGRLDVLVAQAGVVGVRPLLELSDQEWDRVIGINLRGVFISVQEAARLMVKGNGGAIVVVSSTNSFFVESGHAHYSSSKGGVATFVRSAALDLAQYGIRVNAVSPGVIRTRLSAHLTDHPVEGPAYEQQIPMGRYGEPGDVAPAVTFLASDDAAYITGADLVVDGGVTLGAFAAFDDAELTAPLNPTSEPGESGGG